MKAIVKKIHSEPGSHGGVFSFAFVHRDGSPLLHSGRYRSKDSAHKGIRAIKKHCQDDSRYLIGRSSDGKCSFKIKSANGVVIVESVSFLSEHAMQEAVDLIKTHVPVCEVGFEKAPSAS